MVTAREFLGTGWRFPFGFSGAGGLSKVAGVSETSDLDRIRNSLHHIFVVGIGERPMRRRFGSRLRWLNFAFSDPKNMRVLFDLYVRQAVELWEPRVLIRSVSVDDRERRQGRVLIDVEFVIIATNSAGNFVFPHYLNDLNVGIPGTQPQITGV